MPSPDPVAAAHHLAEDVLYPAAEVIDSAEVVPRRYLDQLAAAGLYGLVGPASAGGLDADQVTAGRVVEALGGASLCAAFVWIQHHSVVRALATRPDWAGDLCSGRIRAGIAYAALRRPGPPTATAQPATGGGGWLLDGHAPWVTGWGLVDVVLAGARHQGDVVWLLIDAVDSPSLRVRPVSLAALQASATVRLEWAAHPVPISRVVGIEPFEDWKRRDAAGRSLNGYLAVGVAARCCALLGPSGLDAEVAEVRGLLDRTQPDQVADIRARASVLAVRAATALVARGGGHSVEADQPAARLLREAMFLMVFGQTADIRQAQLARLGA